jgi:UDP-glucuronate decarboxylase
MNAEGDGIHQPMNIGNPGEFTIRQLAEITIELTGSASKLIFQPLPEDDPTQRQPNIARAQRLIGWEPTIPLRQGLQATIAYFRSINLSDFRAPTPNF